MQLADQQAATANRELLMKKDIHNLKDEIAENNSRHEVELIACLKRKEVDNNSALYMISCNYTMCLQLQINSRSHICNQS